MHLRAQTLAFTAASEHSLKSVGIRMVFSWIMMASHSGSVQLSFRHCECERRPSHPYPCRASAGFPAQSPGTVETSPHRVGRLRA